MIRKVLLSTVFAATAGAAVAADLPSTKGPAPFVAPPVFTWTGFYVGLNAGGTWANSNGQYQGVGPVAADAAWGAYPAGRTAYLMAFSQAASASGSNNGSNGGFIGGGQVGYNWQAPYFNNSFKSCAKVSGPCACLI